MDDHVFLPNICERHVNSELFELTAKNGIRVGKPCSNGLITCEYFTSGRCMPHFGKFIDFWETAMPKFIVAQKGNLSTAAEDIFRGNLIANILRHGMVSTGSQHTDQLSLTRTSSKWEITREYCNFPNRRCALRSDLNLWKHGCKGKRGRM